MLYLAIGAAVLAVGAIGAVTATVIVKNDGHGARMVQVAPAPASGQGMRPFGQQSGRGERGSGPLPDMPGMGDLRGCLQQHGLGNPGTRGAAPDLRTMRDALKACRGSLPSLAPRP